MGEKCWLWGGQHAPAMFDIIKSQGCHVDWLETCTWHCRVTWQSAWASTTEVTFISSCTQVKTQRQLQVYWLLTSHNHQGFQQIKFHLVKLPLVSSYCLICSEPFQHCPRHMCAWQLSHECKSLCRTAALFSIGNFIEKFGLVGRAGTPEVGSILTIPSSHHTSFSWCLWILPSHIAFSNTKLRFHVFLHSEDFKQDASDWLTVTETTAQHPLAVWRMPSWREVRRIGTEIKARLETIHSCYWNLCWTWNGLE